MALSPILDEIYRLACRCILQPDAVTEYEQPGEERVAYFSGKRYMSKPVPMVERYTAVPSEAYAKILVYLLDDCATDTDQPRPWTASHWKQSPHGEGVCGADHGVYLLSKPDITPKDIDDYIAYMRDHLVDMSGGWTREQSIGSVTVVKSAFERLPTRDRSSRLEERQRFIANVMEMAGRIETVPTAGSAIVDERSAFILALDRRVQVHMDIVRRTQAPFLYVRLGDEAAGLFCSIFTVSC